MRNMLAEQWMQSAVQMHLGISPTINLIADVQQQSQTQEGRI
jgi:hypothetical protein